MEKILLILFISVSVKAELKKEVFVDKIELLELGYCSIRKAIIVSEDGKQLSKSYERVVISPEGDLSSFDERVKAVCKASWTPDIVKKYKEAVEKTKLEVQGLTKKTGE